MEKSNTEKKIGYRDVFTQKEYCKIILANIISRFGDSIDAIAFTWLVYQVTGSASWSAIIFALNQLPTVLVQPFAGAFVENVNKKHLMVITDLIRGILVAGLAALYYFDQIQPWILVVFVLIISSVEAFHIPAAMAVIPKLIQPEYYSYATSLNSTVCKVMELIGMGIAGVIIGLFGIHTAFYIDAITFFGSALILQFIKLEESGREKTPLNVKVYVDTLIGGAKYLKSQSVIRNFCLLGVVINAIMVPINSLQSPLVSEVLGQGTELLSAFGISISIGMGVGSFIFPKISERIPVREMTVGTGILMGVSIFFYPLGSLFKENIVAIYALTIIASFILGACASLIMSALSVQFVKVVKEDYMARVGAIFNASATAAIPVTSVIVSIAVAQISTAQILLVSSILCVILFVLIEVIRLQLE